MRRGRRRGRRGDGTITERDGRYLARISRTEGGKRTRESRTFDLRNDAEWWLSQARRHGEAPEDIRLGDYLERWLRGKRDVTASTLAQYRNAAPSARYPRRRSGPSWSPCARRSRRPCRATSRTTPRRRSRRRPCAGRRSRRSAPRFPFTTHGKHWIVAPEVTGSSPVGHPTSPNETGHPHVAIRRTLSHVVAPIGHW
jgi:hypothetical protein